MNIGLIAAVPLELKGIVRGWQPLPIPARHIRAWTHSDPVGDKLIAVCAGMGADAARRAFATAESVSPLDLVLSIGLAGACDPALQVGAITVLTEVIDSQTGERFPLATAEPKLRIASLPRVADPAEKRRLRATYSAVVVDMESATVARMARQRQIPMVCIKAVSDAANAALPDINPYLRGGQLRLLPFLASIAVRPAHWAALIQLGRNSSVAAKALTAAVQHFLITKDWETANRTGSLEAKH